MDERSDGNEATGSLVGEGNQEASIPVNPDGTYSVPRSAGEIGGGKSGQVPYHPSASALLVVVDNLWALEDWLILTWILTIPLSFLSVFIPTYWLQRHFRRDSRLTALWKALLFGFIAGVPTSITGTPIGLALLAWAGIKR